MATGSNFSLSCGSDDVPLCTMCPPNAPASEADKYCVECAEYLCTHCLRSHQKWQANRSHVLVPSYEGFQLSGQTLTETCHLHKGNLIDTFCESHEDVFCSACVTFNHRSCHTKPILRLSKGTKTGEEYKKVLTSTHELLQQLKLSKIEVDKYENSFEDKLSMEIENIKDTCKVMRDHFDELEESTIGMVSAVYADKITDLKQNIMSLDTLITSTNDNINELTNSDSDSDAAAFIKVKRTKKMNADAASSLTEITATSKAPLTAVFKLDKYVTDKTKGISSLGKVVQRSHSYVAKSIGSFEIKNLGEIDCDITGSCMLEDGTVLIVDRSNNMLKRLDDRFRVKDQLLLSGKPYDVCQINDFQSVAVSVMEQKRIQFVSLYKVKMKPAASFTVGDQCRGIAYLDGEIFVSCGGSVNEGQGHIEVYDVCGTLKRIIGHDCLQIPIHIVFGAPLEDNGMLLYVTDSKQRAVICLDKDGNRIAVFTDRGISETKGICIANSQVLVSGKRTNAIMQLNIQDGRTACFQKLLQKDDGIVRPCSLIFNPNTSRLIVTMSSNNVAVYKLV